MKASLLKQSSLITLLLTFLLTAGSFAQDKKDDANCCTAKSKVECMDGAKMNHSAMSEMNDSTNAEYSDMTAKQVDNKLEAWNAVFPVRGEEIDPEANKVEYNGKVYGFCCNGCDSKFKANPEKYSKNLSEDGKTFTGTK